MTSKRFRAQVQGGHKEHALAVPFDPAAHFGAAVALEPGRRGQRVRATIAGDTFDTAIVARRGQHWLLLDDALRERRGWAAGDELDVSVDHVPALSPAEPVDVHVAYATSRKGVPSSASFVKWVSAALHDRDAPASVAIRIVAADEGRELNRTYRGKDYATNVLSFPAERPEGLPDDVELPDLGDLVICAEVVAREAAEQGKRPADHYAHLTVHGVLHLLGWDHVEDDQAEAMEARESTILAGLGIADPY